MDFFHHYSAFYFADKGIYEERFVRAKKTQVVLHNAYIIRVNFALTMTSSSSNMAAFSATKQLETARHL